MTMGGHRKRNCFVTTAFSLLLTCMIFPSESLSQRECQGTQHPEVLPHVTVLPISQGCAEARTQQRWSEPPCGTKAQKQEQPAKAVKQQEVR